MRTSTLIVPIALTALFATAAHGADIEAGRQKSASCVGCHGVDGNSDSPVNPDMAGQKEQYLVTTMLDYKTGKRQHTLMQAVLAPMSEEDIRDMAAYYSSQPKCK